MTRWAVGDGTREGARRAVVVADGAYATRGANRGRAMDGDAEETTDGSRHNGERDERDGFRERSRVPRVHAASVSSDALMPLRNRARAEEKKPCTMAPLIRPITSMVLA